MPRASISELKAKLSAFLDMVREGEEVIVTDRGRPIARLAPLVEEAQGESRDEWLIRTGRMIPAKGTLPADFWSRERVQDPEGHLLKALLDERDEAR
jgi:prevent-host-death family protein